jgi:cation diffusion facilitator family transporter
MKNPEDINRRKINVAYTSIIGAIIIVTVKIIASVQSGSLAVLSELFHSSTDFIAAIATVISLKYSAKPPDSKHHYGHEKIESFSALFQVLILIAMCVYIFYEAIERIIHPPVISLNIFTFLAIIICIFIDYSRAKALKKVAKETKSQALEADALHFSSDIWSSIVVILSMLFSYFNISHLFDPISAIIVAMIIIYVTLNLMKKAFNSLMDGVPSGMTEKIYNEVLTIKEVESIKSLRLRSSGSKLFIDMTILISRLLSFAQTHNIIDRIENKIKETLPDSDVVIHFEPIETEKETINEKIRLIVNDMGYKCHDIFSHKINKDIFSELHIEIDDTNDLSKAHDIVTNIEQRILEKIKVISKVKIHLDEPSEKLFDTKDITSESDIIINKIKNITLINELSKILSEIKVIETNNKIRILLTCEFDLKLSFDEVHDRVTTLENRIYSDLKIVYPNLASVIIHAEPGV